MTVSGTNGQIYPAAMRGSQRDDYHGTSVADPYRWLEDLDSPETRTWIAAQSALAERFFAQIPERDVIRERLAAVWDYERFGVPTKVGSRYAFSKNSGLQNQSPVFIAETLGGEPQLFIDPNGFSDDGTVALSGLSFSPDGRRAAYATSASGSDWMVWHVRDVETGRDLEDRVEWCKFSGASWHRDGSGFFYSRYAEPDPASQLKAQNFNQRLYFHAIGTEQSADQLIYERPDRKEWGIGGYASEDGAYLIIMISEGTDPNNRLFVKSMKALDQPALELLPDADARYQYLGNDGTTLYCLTTLAAPRGRIVAIDLQTRVMREIVAESSDVLAGAGLFDDVFIAEYVHDATSLVRRYDLHGQSLGDLALPGLGSADGFGGRRDAGETFFSFTSYITPASIFALTPATGETALVFGPQIAFDAAAYTSTQVFYTSKDGTRIPMMITARKDTPRDGTAPAIMSGYGGFDISLMPAFSPAILVWLDLGGIFAVPNIRGGGEYGEAWHRAGTKAAKQNVFDDFIAAAEFLISQRYTSAAKLAMSGGSNGGLLVGACLTQRPELFGAALPAVGVLDMLRFQKFTIGWAWTSDYGSSDNPDDFPYLYAYSPLHNIRMGAVYPPTFITTGDHDDRVFPGHSFKFAAALQAAQGGSAPVLVRIDTKAGHGAGKPTNKVLDEVADRYAFLVNVFGMTLHEERT